MRIGFFFVCAGGEILMELGIGGIAGSIEVLWANFDFLSWDLRLFSM
jgi:hypothetical protein